MKIEPQTTFNFLFSFCDFIFSGIQSAELQMVTPDFATVDIEYLPNKEDSDANELAVKALSGELKIHQCLVDGQFPTFSLTLTRKDGQAWKRYIFSEWVVVAPKIKLDKRQSEKLITKLSFCAKVKTEYLKDEPKDERTDSANTGE